MNSFVESVFQDFLVDCEPKEKVNFVCFEDEENVGELFGLMSDILFGRIVYMKNGERQVTQSLAVKQLAGEGSADGQADYCSMQLANEIHFFSKVLPSINTLTKGRMEAFFPKFLFSNSRIMPSYDRNVVIYENLRAVGFQMASSAKMQNNSSSKNDADLLAVFPDYAHLSLMMRKLGQFHAHSIAAAKINPSHFQFIATFQPRLHENSTRKYSNLLRVLMKKYIRLLSANPLYEPKLASFEKMVENLENSLFSVNNPKSISVICHGDYTVTNVLFKYDKNGLPIDMKMLDLGLWRLSSPALDLSHLLYVNADQEMRDRHWHDLMNDYFNGLADILPSHDLPSRLQIEEEFRLNGWYGFLIASFFVVNRIAAVENVPNVFEEINSHHPDKYIVDVSTEDLQKVFENNYVGGRRAIEAVLNVLRDMVDRKFI